MWKQKRLWTAKAVLSKKINAGGSSISNIKLYYRAIAIKTAWYWHKTRHEDQWNRNRYPDMNPQGYAHLIFDKVPKTWWRVERLQKCCWEKWLSACRKLKVDPCLSPCTSINSKKIKDLNVRTETLNLVQERAGNTLKAKGIGKDFFNRTLAAQYLGEKMDKWDYMKLKCFCTTKTMVCKLKKPPTE
jgi:hypothetical protein